MPRINPQVESLAREVEFLKRTIERMRQEPGDVPFVACDNSCIITRPTGVATNGGCRCDERTLRRAVMYLRRRCEFQQVIIQELRGDVQP